MALRGVKGTRDILPAEVSRWRLVEALTHEIFARYGFEEIRTPVFEHSEVFEKGTGETSEIVQKEMYRFTDLGKNDLTLRPEGTPPVIRSYLEHHIGEGKSVDKLYYIGPMFRYERPQKGRYRQFHQVGGEAFGSDSPLLDAEIIEMAMVWLERLGVVEVTLGINSVGDQACRPRYQEALLAAQQQRLQDLCADCNRRHASNPLRVFDCKNPTCASVIQELPTIQEFLCGPCADHFERLRDELQHAGVVAHTEPRLVRGLDYYRRTVFEVKSAALGAQDALIGGGRYDGLIRRMGGADIPAVGFASGIERILLAMPEIARPAVVDLFVALQDRALVKNVIELLRRLRRQGISCMMDYQERSLRAQLRAAHRAGIPALIVVGPDELETGNYTIKRMADGHSITIAADSLPERLRALLAETPTTPAEG